MLIFYKQNAPDLFSRKEDDTQEKTFAPLMINILLDQHSSVASLGQQAIIAVVSVLREDQNLLQVIDSEIHKGLIEGLMAIVDGKIKRQQQTIEEEGGRRVSVDEIERRRSSLSAAPGFETSHAADDDFDQGEISLAKITCISVSFAF
jgi:hypothetical protein